MSAQTAAAAPAQAQAAPRHPHHRARPRILLALREKGRPTDSLLRASALARLHGADLHVVRVLARMTRANPLFPECNFGDAMHVIERSAKAGRRTRAWLGDVLGEPSTSERFALLHGDFADQVAAYATDIGAGLIVVSARHAYLGKTVTSIVRMCRVPVLVARKAGRNETIVAATGMQTSGYPVLNAAAEIGQRLHARVIVLHNVSPVSVAVCTDMAWSLTAFPQKAMRAVRERRLIDVARGLAGDVQSVVSGDLDAADAIVGEARTRAADLIVVGARARGWLGRLFTPGIAARVVARAKRSILVIPLDA